MVKGKRWLSCGSPCARAAHGRARRRAEATTDRQRRGDEGLTGSITISGSSTVEPISSLVAELFRDAIPDVTINVDGPGTGDGFELFCDGETDITDASRPIDDEEATACEEAGIEYMELEVALDGITVMANPTSAIDVPEPRDLYALFGPESEGFDDWSDANALASEVGGNGGFPDVPLDITAPGEESGTYDAFIESRGIDDTRDRARGSPRTRRPRCVPTTSRPPNDNVIIQAMEGSPSAMGFVGFAFAENAGDAVKEFEVDGGDGCVAPSSRDDLDGSYPLVPVAVHLRQHGQGRGERGPPGVRGLLPDRRGSRRWRSRRRATSPSPTTACRPPATAWESAVA